VNCIAFCKQIVFKYHAIKRQSAPAVPLLEELQKKHLYICQKTNKRIGNNHLKMDFRCL